MKTDHTPSLTVKNIKRIIASVAYVRDRKSPTNSLGGAIEIMKLHQADKEQALKDLAEDIYVSSGGNTMLRSIIDDCLQRALTLNHADTSEKGDND
jgi:hypothetical protein